MQFLLDLVAEKELRKKDIYRYFGISRQAASKRLHKEFREQKMMENIRFDVEQYRENKDRRAGSRSSFYNLNIKQKYGIGITKYEQLMSKYGLSLAPLRVKVVTTKSSLQSWNHDNRLNNGFVLNAVNQVVVGDLTYVGVGEERYFVFNLMDLYSGYWCGIYIHERMRAIDALHALKALIKLRGKENLKGCIHHTDGGGQYFSKVYQGVLVKNGFEISVAQTALENGFAEQRNAFLKHHILPLIKPRNLKSIQAQLAEKIRFYNKNRKQKSLGWRTPEEYERDMMLLPVEKREQKKLHDFNSGVSKAKQ